MHSASRPFIKTLLTLSIAAGLSLSLTGCDDLKSKIPGLSSEATQAGMPATLEGEITTSSPVNLNDGSRYQSFSLTLKGGDVIKVASSGALEDPVMILMDSANRTVSGPSAGQLFADPAQDGTYTLTVSSASDRDFGPFTLTLTTIEVRNSGVLEVGDEIMGLLKARQNGNDYELNVTEEGLYELAMSSEDFDTVIKLTGNGLDLEDDDGAGEGTDSKLTAFLQPGTYQFNAADLDNTEGGGYTLSFTRRELPAGVSLVNGGILTVGTEITGMTTSDALDYMLEVTEAGMLQVEMHSDDIDSYLEISGNGVEATDDDSAGDLNARLLMPVQPGNYTIKASSLGGDSGLFTLKAELSAAAPAGGSISVGDRVYGTVKEGDTETTRLTVTEGGSYQIDLISSDFDALLKLRGQGRDEENDDGADGTNSRLNLTLQPGVYELISGSYGDSGAGTYVLSVSRSGN